jgi:hypothetical protein
MKPLFILLILALGPALGEMTAPVAPAPLVTVSSVTDVHQLPDDNTNASVEPAAAHKPNA